MIFNHEAGYSTYYAHINGFGGAGGGWVVSGVSLTITPGPSTPPGTNQVRGIGLSPIGQFIGTFSDAVTVVVE